MRLRIFRDFLKLNQTDMAKKLGVKQRAYSGYETGRNSLPDSTYEFLDHLGVNLQWLLTGSGPMLKSKLTEKIYGVDPEDLTHRQKAEIVVNDIIRRTPKDVKMDLSGNNLELTIRAVEKLSLDFDYSLKKLYEHTETLLTVFFPKLNLDTSDQKGL